MTTVAASLFDVSAPPVPPGGDGATGQPATETFGALLGATMSIDAETTAAPLPTAVAVRPAPVPSGQMVLTLAQPTTPLDAPRDARVMALPDAPLPEAPPPITPLPDLSPIDAPTPPSTRIDPASPPPAPPAPASKPVPGPATPAERAAEVPCPPPGVSTDVARIVRRPTGPEITTDADADEEADGPAAPDVAATPAVAVAVAPLATAVPVPAPVKPMASITPPEPPPADQRIAVAADQHRQPFTRGDTDPAPAPAAVATDPAAPAPATGDTGPAFTVPAAPLPATKAASATAAGSITAQPGRIGQELGVAIARHVAGHGATGGNETITLRLNPVDMGRIEVKLSFDDGGTLRAIVSADNPIALDMLRRDSADLGRALVDAGVRSDTQTLRFDTRTGADAGGGKGGGGQPWHRPPEERRDIHGATPEPLEDVTARYRPLRSRSRIDLVA